MNKRLIDLLLSIIGLLLFAPFGLLIAMLIKVDSQGPIFYRQERVGYLGRTFRIWKFRSMKASLHREGPTVTRSGDPRVTRLGKVLRQWKLDEIPQLINVLAGQMSLVGPRPEVPQYVELYTEEQRRVLHYRPGITDLASIIFRDEEKLLARQQNPEQFYRNYCLPRKIELNLAYAANANVITDLKLVMATLWIILPWANPTCLPEVTSKVRINHQSFT